MVDLAVEGLGAGELIGGGASSSVFAATRMAFGDRVAVKVLKQTLTDEQSRSHFEREARALTELADIPGIVAVLDSGVNTRGEPYLVFPLFENSAQGDVNANGAMAADRAVRIVAGAARAVHGGHQRGVIHRDLKPANLLLTQSDDIFVSDFGIAKLTDSSVSASGWLGLTPAYAPPEALEGLPAGVLGDVYSLGATLAALVIGAPPFSSTGSESPIALLNRVVNQPAPDLALFGAPAGVAAAVAKAMAKDPAQRFTSALELALALEATAAHPATAVSDAAPASPPNAPQAVSPPTPPTPAPNPPPAAVSPQSSPSPQHIVQPGPSAPPLASPAATSAPQGQPGAQPAVPGKATNKVALGAGAAVAVAAIVGGVIAFGMRGDDTASTPLPTSVVVEQPTVEPEPQLTAAPPTAVSEPTVAPTVASPTPAVAEPAFPPAVAGGPVDVYPDGTGEASNLTAAIARALDGDVIRLAAGTYDIAAVIRVQSDVTIIGAGIDETILVASGGPTVFFFDGTAARLRGLTVTSSITPDDEGFGLIEANQSPGLVLDNVKTLDAPGFGFAVIDSTVTVTNSAFVGSRSSGVGIDDSSTAQIVASAASNNDDSGFVVIDDSSAVFLNNEARDNGESGFRFEGAGNIELVSNSAANNSASGFQFANTAAPRLEGNTSVDNSEAGFAWFGAAAGTATGNTAARNERAGFSMTDQSAPTLTANRSNDNSESGFLWAGEASGSVAANTAVDNGLNGYALIESAQPALRANTASSNSEGDLFTNTSVDGVVIDESGVIRVEVDSSGDAATVEAAVAQARNGDVIRLGPGVHQLSTRVLVSKDLTIVGAGPSDTTIDVSDGNAVFLIENTPVRLLDMTLTTSFETDDDAARFSVVEIDSSTEFTVDNVVIAGSVGIGLGLFDSTGTVSNSQVTDSFWSGIGLSENAQVTISDVAATNNGQSGVVFFEDAGGIVAGNVADGNQFFGFSVQGAGDPQVFGNVASNNQASGFAHAETASPNLIGNVARGNGAAGFIWFDSTSGEATANAAFGNSTSGFHVAAEASPTLVANESNRNEIDGFTWFDTSSGEAVGNIATGNVLDGFAAEDESSPTLQRNAAFDNERRAWNQSGEATPVLADNEFG